VKVHGGERRRNDWAGSISAAANPSPPCGASSISRASSGCAAQCTTAARPCRIISPACPATSPGPATPAGKNERLELKKAGFNVRQGINAKAFGINLVTRWLCSGRLKIVRSFCPNLTSEAPRYRYAGAKDGFPESEEPVNEFNHGMDAKRYLFSREPPPPPLALPATAASPAGPGDSAAVPPVAPAPPPARKSRAWCRIDNEAVWTRIC